MSNAALWLRESSEARRFGLKGLRAAELLHQRGFEVPTRANTWAPLRAQDRDDSPNLIARLGHTEFFLETADATADELERSLAGEPGVYPVLRQDSAFVLGGPRATDALAEVCNVDFAALAPAEKQVVMTLMAGVAILALPQATDDGIIHRIWCDPSFGPYLWETLAEVVQTTTGRAA
jgi:sarcosine oxidase subunit gamma